MIDMFSLCLVHSVLHRPLVYAAGRFKSLLLPLPALGKGDKVGPPQTPPRGCRPLDPCLARLLNNPVYAAWSEGTQDDYKPQQGGGKPQRRELKRCTNDCPAPHHPQGGGKPHPIGINLSHG